MSRQRYVRAALLTVLVTSAPILLAQAPPAAAQAVDPAYDDIIFLPSLESARSAIAAATADARLADEQGAHVRTERMRTRSQIEIAKSELETVKRRLELAKKEKNEAEQAELEAERGKMETRVKLLERWRDVHEAAVRASEAQQAAAQSRRKVAEAEIELIEKRDQRRARGAGDSASTTAIDDELRRSARRVLELRREDAGRRREYAERERQVAQQQLDLLETRVKAGR